jgi:hypothetical protein
MYQARCNYCAWSDQRHKLIVIGASARQHEQTAGHYVTVWDGPTSQASREIWGGTSRALVSTYPLQREIGTLRAVRLWELRAADWAWAVVKWSARPGYEEDLDNAYSAMQSARATADWHREHYLDRRVAALFEG